MKWKRLLKREFGNCLINGRSRGTSIRSNVLETIAQGGGVVSHVKEDGTVRMKITVRKEDLKQMLGMINCEKNTISTHLSPSSPFSPVEERLNLLRRRHLLRENAMRKSCQCSWSPQLQSIPEDE
ncbi:hypothetical protein SLEP1_g30918 [Rubroshorea leprosula]|uniref:LAGLIDADG homing endonuclease n=1 Tax=Rubroshorea leprosula TaxID=152421 RepID=A0AAV5K9Q5_9ROSI|nr:hypothetical protein SLEP1_g30918 [Rubroshorea leprosula]